MSEKKRVLISLHSNVGAFHLSAEEEARAVERLHHRYDVIVAEGKEEFLNHLPEAEIVIGWIFKPEWYALAVKLTHAYTPAAGKDWFAEDPSGQVPVTHGTFHGELMRETLIGMMLHFNRNLGSALDDRRNRAWNRDHYSMNRRLAGQRILIIGYGSIGRSCAKALSGLGCSVIGVHRSPFDPAIDAPAEDVIHPDELPSILSTVDHVVLILPSGAETEGMITREHFTAMKPSAYLYNIGRGNCYQEDDLVWALESGQIAGAGLDVFAIEPLPTESRLWELDNVLLLPHASAMCREYLPVYMDELIPQLISGV